MVNFTHAIVTQAGDMVELANADGTTLEVGPTATAVTRAQLEAWIAAAGDLQTVCDRFGWRNMTGINLPGAVHSDAPIYGGRLTEALDDALQRSRPLVIAPGVYDLVEPLVLRNTSQFNVFAYGATLRSRAPMPALVELQGCDATRWHGGVLAMTHAQYRVDNAFWIRNAVAGQNTTGITVRDVHIGSYYTCGLRVGDLPGSEAAGRQCDHVLLDNITLSGVGTPDPEPGLCEYGLYLGDGAYGNNLTHSINTLNALYHDYNLYVNRTNANVTNFGGGYARISDVYAVSPQFALRGVRTEGSRALYLSPVTNNAPALARLADVLWHARPDSSEYVMDHRQAGSLLLENILISTHPGAAAPRVRLRAGTPDGSLTLGVTVAGLMMSNTRAAAFDAGASVALDVRHYVEIQPFGGVVRVHTS